MDESLLLRLCMPDTNTIQQATAEFRLALKNPDNIVALCQLVVTSTYPQVRQYAAILFKKCIRDLYRWKSLPDNVHKKCRELILQALVNEEQYNIKKSIAELISALYDSELYRINWPEIHEFAEQFITNEELLKKELGICTLSIITEFIPNLYHKSKKSLISLLGRTLNGLQDNLGNTVSYFILKIMKNIINRFFDSEDMNTYNQMMPLVIATIQAFTTKDENRAIECFELLVELHEHLNTVMIHHSKSIVSMCLSIATNESLSDPLRVRALYFVGWLARKRTKSLLKHKLVEPIIDTLFVLLTKQPDNESDYNYISGENDNDTLITVAAQTIELLAWHLPAENLIPHMLQYIESGLQGTDIHAKKAVYVAMAMLAEGCCEYIRSKYLENFLHCICHGIAHPSPAIRNAALFALGQFSIHLQPEISQYSSTLLPLLFEYLSQVCIHIKQEKKEPPSINRMFYALEMFCENLNGSLLPYLPTLMERLFEILSMDTPMHVKELALSVISSAASASKEHMLPYFERIITILDSYLTMIDMCLKIQAIDTLGAIARTIGKQHFAPLISKYLNFGMKLLKETEEPDVRKSIYGLFASISTVIKKEMAMFLPEIVEYMLLNIRNSDGFVTHDKDEEAVVTSDFANFIEIEEEDREYSSEEEYYEEDKDTVGQNVENVYIDEKKTAILALKEIAEYTEEAFLPHLTGCFEEIFKLTDYPLEDIRKASVQALVQFCINFSKIDTNEGKQALMKALSMLVSRLAELVRLDEKTVIVITALDAYTELLKTIKSDVLVEEGHKDAIINSVEYTLRSKNYYIRVIDGEVMLPEQDEAVMDCAGELLINLGKILAPEDFVIYFFRVLPLLKDILGNNQYVELRAFAAGTIADCVSSLKDKIKRYISELLPTFLRLTEHPYSEMRNNVIYGIGEMVLYGKEEVYSYYPAILESLSTALEKESDAGTRDNIVGAIARLMIVNYLNLPLEQMFPIFVEQLPLKADFVENEAVFRSILMLYQAGHAVLPPHIHTLLKVAVSVLHEEKTGSNEATSLIIEFIKSTQRDFPNDWNALSSELPAEVITNMQRIFS